jgi:hypothetical protein
LKGRARGDRPRLRVARPGGLRRAPHGGDSRAAALACQRLRPGPLRPGRWRAELSRHKGKAELQECCLYIRIHMQKHRSRNYDLREAHREGEPQ